MAKWHTTETLLRVELRTDVSSLHRSLFCFCLSLHVHVFVSISKNAMRQQSPCLSAFSIYGRSRADQSRQRYRVLELNGGQWEIYGSWFRQVGHKPGEVLINWGSKRQTASPEFNAWPGLLSPAEWQKLESHGFHHHYTNEHVTFRLSVLWGSWPYCFQITG